MRNDRVYVLRESVVKITQMLSGKGIRVTQQGVNAYVRADHNGVPILVNLPYLPDNAGEDLCNAIQGFLDHEVAHILFTEFPLMGEANKISRQVGFLLNALEDPRIEKEMAKRFQGSAYNLANTGKFFLDKFIVPKLAECKGDRNKMAQVLMVPMLRAMSGQQVFQEFMKNHWSTVESVYSRIKDLDDRVEATTSTRDCYELAKEIGKRLAGKHEGEPGEEGEATGPTRSKGKTSDKGKDEKSKPASGEDTSGDGEDSGESGENKDGDGDAESESKNKSDTGGKGKDDEKKEDDSGEGDKDDEDDAEGSGEGDDEEEGDVGEEPDGEDDDGLIKAGRDKMPDGAAEDEEEGEINNEHPIWAEIDRDGTNGYDDTMSRLISESALKSASNADYLPFTKDHDLIEKFKVGSMYDPIMTKRLIDKVEHMVAPLQKDLERAIAAKSLATRSHGHRSGRLHAANLSRLAFNDDRVFSRKHENMSKDVAVELVVDASGSMSGSKIHTAAQAAYALSSVLERLNIANEVICFTTKDIGVSHHDLYKQQSETGIRFSRAEGLYMPILKGYDERIANSGVKERFGWLPNSNILRSNVDGECVEAAFRRLMKQRQAGKIMIVLSDGYPAAAGSRGDLEQHLKRVVEDISRSGTKIVGIGIGSDAVRRFYPKSIVLNNVSELPTAVIKELRQLLMA